MFNMITGINESKTLRTHISCESKCNFDGRKFHSDQKWNNDKCQCQCGNHYMCEKDYIQNPTICSFRNGKCLASIIDDSVIICDEIIYAETKTIPTSFNKRNAICETKKFHILLAFLLITIVLLIAVSVYCYLTKYLVKQKQLLPLRVTNNKLKKVLY